MEFFLKWLIFASVGFAVTVAPGPAFAFTVRNAIAHGRKSGIISCIGLGIGIAFLVTLVMTGFALLISQSLTLFNILRYCGAAYLIYMGVKALQAKPHKQEDNQLSPGIDYRPVSNRKAFLLGLFTNATNPKAMIYFTAVFAQFITPEMIVSEKIIYAATPVVTEILWFSCVVMVLTDRRVRAKFLGISHWIERVCGGLMIAVGLKLAVSKI